MIYGVIPLNKSPVVDLSKLWPGSESPARPTNPPSNLPKPLMAPAQSERLGSQSFSPLLPVGAEAYAIPRELILTSERLKTLRTDCKRARFEVYFNAKSSVWCVAREQIELLSARFQFGIPCDPLNEHVKQPHFFYSFAPKEVYPQVLQDLSGTGIEPHSGYDRGLVVMDRAEEPKPAQHAYHASSGHVVSQ